MAATRLKRRKFPTINEEFYYNQLENGMTVFLIPKESFKETLAVMSSRFGSIDTNFTVNGKKKSYLAGIAHLLEHQLFEMNKQKDAAYEFTKLGAESNAYTTFDKTIYYFSTADNIKKNLDLLQEFTSQINFTDMSIEKEKKIITQEFNMYQDDSDDYLYQVILSKLYPQTSLAEDITGNRDSIDKLTKNNLEENFHYFYQPENLTLLVAGDFDVKRVYKDIVTTQRQLPDRPKFEIKRSPLKLLPITPTSSMQMDISISKLAVGFRFNFIKKKPKSLIKERLLLKLFFLLLFGWTSEHYQQWYEDRKIDDSFELKIEVSTSYQFVVILLDTKEPIAMSNKIGQTIKKFKTDTNLSAPHLQTVKKELYGDFIRSLDSLEALSSQFIDNLWGEETYFDFPTVLQNIEIKDVLEFGEKITKEMQLTDFTLFPK
ncbi:EF-P 5-aminopentanol modification-associated protein YfmH [Streptococcus mutans]|uniref:EF-P 5-aminopentanol modification-associated protein YfmH n=1 Tax=Streptococcus mutans TaxID=1309 RepID=UPI0002B5E08D|nr:pitrilysin family protein [Streptococcus mutans]EMB56848.1 putative peptidase [Streptococcus mutans NLML8]EMB69156.1 putative peptidase [Streptococcus mutans 2ST1]EMC10005.1 putative peptidase [Streptococcus mutans NLML9]EMC17815.1 putative peptidase [Streptococcus mutans NV1996]EMC30806.1 putative peptidase [Streptococcus mutans U2A]